MYQTHCINCPQVSESALQCVKIQEQGGFVGCGAKDGSVTLIELGQTLARMQPNEKQSISAVCVRLPRPVFMILHRRIA